MSLEKVIEGRTPLLVPEARTESGPGKKQGRVFYNHQMAFNRDVSVMFFAHPEMRIGRALDAMAATGARAVRIMNEARPQTEFHINDWEPEAYDVIRQNIALNELEGCVARNEDLRCLLAKEKFDYIDLDPFGTPVPFLHPAIQALRRNGVLAITATDTAPLAGTHAKKCVRRYQARPLRCVFGHEAGLRILIGYVARQAAMFDRGVEPLLCFYADHYMRLYLRMPETAESADLTLEKLGYLRFDRETHERETSKDWSKGASGPFWLGSIHDPAFVKGLNLIEGLAQPNRCKKYLDLWQNEIDVPYFYENNELSSEIGCSPLKLERLLEGMAEIGKVSKTHFSPTGFKSDQPYAKVRERYIQMHEGR
ncbi:MAG: tRNA (guanine(26)-N(2))-dimethyltransferase [Methanomassiliicoccales archaeon PtaU1.Bin124]|nr:MAG: tRNA (guanine(26)-N(2))-dimethyltransferase [Methanomassiliicoccales archaeon PtaU1.Bin124]